MQNQTTYFDTIVSKKEKKKKKKKEKERKGKKIKIHMEWQHEKVIKKVDMTWCERTHMVTKLGKILITF